MSLQASGSTDPGRLDRRVTLQYPVRERDANGSWTTNWANATDVWASKRVVSGQRAFAADQKQAIDVVVFRIRWRSELQQYWRLKHGENVFEIIPPLEEQGRHAFIDLTCRGINQPIGNTLNVLTLEGSTSSSYLQLEDGSALLLETAA